MTEDGDCIRVGLDAHVVGRRKTGNEAYVVGLGNALATRDDIDLTAFLDSGPHGRDLDPSRVFVAHGAVDGRSVTYRREALADLDEHSGMGAIDTLHQRMLVASGAALLADDGIRVVHDQSLGFGGTVVIHFHAGRTFAAFRRQRQDVGQFVRLLATPIVPVARFIRTARLVASKGYGRELFRAAPAIWLLLVVQTAGQVIGLAAGPGDSPTKVQ